MTNFSKRFFVVDSMDEISYILITLIAVVANVMALAHGCLWLAELAGAVAVVVGVLMIISKVSDGI